MMTNLSLHQVDEEDLLQRVKSAGIPPVPEADFKPTKRLYLAFGTLAVITLMVALDGTSLSVALPVILFTILATFGHQYRLTRSDHGTCSEGYRSRGFLGWHIIPSLLHNLSAKLRRTLSRLWSKTSCYGGTCLLPNWRHYCCDGELVRTSSCWQIPSRRWRWWSYRSH